VIGTIALTILLMTIRTNTDYMHTWRHQRVMHNDTHYCKVRHVHKHIIHTQGDNTQSKRQTCTISGTSRWSTTTHTTAKCVDKHCYINTLDVITTTTSVKVHKRRHHSSAHNDAHYCKVYTQHYCIIHNLGDNTHSKRQTALLAAPIGAAHRHTLLTLIAIASRAQTHQSCSN
jgi:hypothetical protein